MPSAAPGSPAMLSSRAKWMVTVRGAIWYSSGSMVGFPAGTRTPSRALTSRSAAEPIVSEPRHPPHELVGGGKARGAVGQRLRHVLGVDGVDTQRTLALEDDAGVHEAARAGAGLVGDLGAEWQLRRQPGLELLPRQDIQGEPTQLRRAAQLPGDGGIGRPLQDHLQQQALIMGRCRGHLLERVVAAQARRNAEAMDRTGHAD